MKKVYVFAVLFFATGLLFSCGLEEPEPSGNLSVSTAFFSS